MSNDLFLKQLNYRSNHRGCKETDILLGKFFNEKFDEISDLKNYGELIEEDDMLIYDWIMKKTPVLQKYQKLVSQIQQFHQI